MKLKNTCFFFACQMNDCNKYIRFWIVFTLLRWFVLFYFMPWRCQLGTSRYSVPLGTTGHGELELRLPSSRDGAASRFTYSLRGGMRGNMKLKFHPDIGVNFPINRPARKTVVLWWSRHCVNLDLTSQQVAFAFALQLICLAFKQFFCNKKI